MINKELEKEIENCLKEASLENTGGTIVSMRKIRQFVKRLNEKNINDFDSQDFLELCGDDKGYLCDSFDAFHIMSLIRDRT